jgi:hypothetical protein
VLDGSASSASLVQVPRMPCQLAHRSNVIRLFIVAVQREPLGDLPYEHLPIVGARCDNSVIEGVPNRVSLPFEPPQLHIPVCVQHRPSVPSEEGDLLGQSAFLVDWYHSKRASTTSFPIDGEVVWICLVKRSARPSRTKTRFAAQTFTKLVSHALRLM